MTKPIRRILAYVDGTEQSVTAAQYAIVLAKSLGAELFALYVVNTRALSELVKAHIFLDSEQEEYHRDLDEDAERYLNHVRNLARSKGVAVTA
ncbi:MAG TPA: universal stress protein, partial [Spirochaetales bacterium]|nr:universal stress protein [Spirochaetales bacterium]